MKVCRMRNLAAALALALVLCATPARADDVAFSHVTVVDVVEGRLLRDQVVRVAGGRIVDVGPRLAPGSRRRPASSMRRANFSCRASGTCTPTSLAVSRAAPR